jgi:hypothetical protein
MPSINQHFSREVKIMIGLFVAFLLSYMIAAFVVPYLSHHIDVDRCLIQEVKLSMRKISV